MKLAPQVKQRVFDGGETRVTSLILNGLLKLRLRGTLLRPAFGETGFETVSDTTNDV